MDRKTLGSFIAVLRKSKGMTQQDVANALNVSNKTVSKWERDESSPDITIIPVLAEMFEVTCDELLKGERIISEDFNDRSGKIDKQIEYIMRNSIYKFKNSSVIAGVLVLMGAICGFVAYSAFYKPEIGLGILLLFSAASVVVELISINRIDNQFDDKVIVDRQHMEKVYITKFRYSYWVFYANFATVFINFLTIVGIDPKYDPPVFPFIGFILVLVYFTTVKLYKWSIFKISKAKMIEYRDAFRLNLFQFSGAVSTGIIYISKVNTGGSIINDNNSWHAVQNVEISDFSFWILALVTIICFPVFLFISKNKKPVVRAGIRNIILFVLWLAVLFIGTI